MKVILGIDPGLAATGYGVICCEESCFRHIAHGTIRTSPRDGVGQRLLQLHGELLEVLDSFRPQEAGVESVYFSKNSNSAIPVAQARGVILYTLAARGVAFSEYTPQELKQAVVGRGTAEKRQVQEMLRMIFALREAPTPDHAADALAVALCHGSTAGFLQALRQGHV